MNTQQQSFKDELISRAKEHSACAPEYKRALEAQSIDGLLTVVKDNFLWLGAEGIIDVELFSPIKEDAERNNIHLNVDVVSGFLIAGENSTVTARGNSTVTARGNSTVTAWDNSTVTAWENSTVTAWENSTVTAWDNSTVTARGNSTVTARDNSTVTAWENSTVTAWDNSYIQIRSTMECKISDHVIVRYHDTNKVEMVCKEDLI